MTPDQKLALKSTLAPLRELDFVEMQQGLLEVQLAARGDDEVVLSLLPDRLRRVEQIVGGFNRTLRAIVAD